MQRSWADHVAQVREEHRREEGPVRREAGRGPEPTTRRSTLCIAIDYAYATVEEAEYAVLDAISARMEANDLAMTS